MDYITYEGLRPDGSIRFNSLEWLGDYITYEGLRLAFTASIMQLE